MNQQYPIRIQFRDVITAHLLAQKFEPYSYDYVEGYTMKRDGATHVLLLNVASERDFALFASACRTPGGRGHSPYYGGRVLGRTIKLNVTANAAQAHCTSGAIYSCSSASLLHTLRDGWDNEDYSYRACIWSAGVRSIGG